MPIDFRRQKTAKKRLKIDWQLPVYAPDLEAEREEGKTYGGRARLALPREEALLNLGSDDRRPLLIVRECGFCKSPDEVVLSRRLDNERTLLLSQWFHCVKLPNHVLKQNHPFRNLFTEKHPPHLFLCRYDGTGVIPMDGQQSQSELWAAMQKLIALEYDEKPKAALKGLLKCLNDYDTIDSLEDEYRAQLESALDKHGPKHGRVKRLSSKLEELGARRKKVEEREAELRDLGLKAKPVATEPAAKSPAHSG